MTEVDRSRLEQIYDAVIGPRQTVDVVEVPGVGRGRIVSANGPTFFLLDGPLPLHPDVGAIAYRVERLDGEGSGVTDGTWKGIRFPGQLTVKAKSIARGDRHDRYYSTIFGDGWLISEATGKTPGYWYRFESKEGEVKLRFSMIALGVGRPAYYDKMMRAQTKMPKMDDPDEDNWTTFVAVGGERFAFRRKGPPPAADAPKEDSKQTSLFPEIKD